MVPVVVDVLIGRGVLFDDLVAQSCGNNLSRTSKV